MTITTQVNQCTTMARVSYMQPPSAPPPGLIHTQNAREESWPEGNGKDVKPLSDVTSAHGKDMCDAPQRVSCMLAAICVTRQLAMAQNLHPSVRSSAAPRRDGSFRCIGTGRSKG